MTWMLQKLKRDSQEEIHVNLLDYLPTAYELQHWTGSGLLQWRQNTWECEFVLSRLLNGRLRFIVKPQDWRRSYRFVEQYPLEFESELEDGYQISVSGIHFTRGIMDDFPWEVFLGYAGAASRQKEREAQEVSLRCDLTNYSLNQRLGPVEFRINEFDISLERLGWNDQSGIEEHSYAYNHAPVLTCLKIEDIGIEEVSEARDCIRDITSQLSIACRGYVFVVAQHIFNRENGIIRSEYKEPAFPNKGWVRPFIPSDYLEQFLAATCYCFEDRADRLELAHIIDHYLHAFAMRSSWPLAVGMLTAMETLKTAFFRRYPEEADAFGSRRPSYRTQLESVFERLDVEANDIELQEFINTRNQIIHEGTPVSVTTPVEDYEDTSSEAWQRTQKAASLFERTLLAYLGYSGPCEFLDLTERV